MPTNEHGGHEPDEREARERQRLAQIDRLQRLARSGYAHVISEELAAALAAIDVLIVDGEGAA